MPVGFNKSPTADRYRRACVRIQGWPMDRGYVHLSRRIAYEPLLAVTCGKPEYAARMLLDWAAEDLPAAAEYLAGFFARVFAELRVDESYLKPKPGMEGTSFGSHRGSYAQIAFFKFCELLIENPDLIAAFRTSDHYPRQDSADATCFGNRADSRLAARRGRGWDDGFIDGAPISEEVRLRHELARKLFVADQEAKSRPEPSGALIQTNGEEAAIRMTSQGSLDLRVSGARSPLAQENSDHPDEKANRDQT